MDQESLFGADEPKARATQMYESPDGKLISGHELARASQEVQIDVMRTWFFQNFEDPVESTPYESAEGGYLFVYGGPYDANNELQSEFAHIVPYEVIETLVDELNETSVEWAPNSNRLTHDFDDYLFEASAATSRHHEAFENSILNIKRLMEVKGIEAADYQAFLRMLYTGVITALETYLSDRFISSVDSDPAIQRKFVETTPDFEEKTVRLADIFQVQEKIGETVKAHLTSVVWHRLEKVMPMYRDTFSIRFPSELGELFRAIKIRHDLVHRNGKTREGKEHILNERQIAVLIEHVESFIASVESQFPTPVDPKDDSPF